MKRKHFLTFHTVEGLELALQRRAGMSDVQLASMPPLAFRPLPGEHEKLMEKLPPLRVQPPWRRPRPRPGWVI